MSKTFKNLLGLVFLALFGFGMYQGSESDARRDAFNAFIGAVNPHITASDALVDRNANLSKDHPDQSQEFFLAELTAIVAESRSILDQFKSIATDDAEIVAMRDQLTPYFASRHEYYEALLAIAKTAPEEDLFDPQRFAWTEGEPFYNWIAVNTYDHYADHIPDLTQLSSAD